MAADTSPSSREETSRKAVLPAGITGPKPFSITIPDGSTGDAVSAARFGLSSDATGAVNEKALRKAVDYCRIHGTRTLTIPPGTYKVGHYVEGKERAVEGQLILNDLTDFVLDGQGATFMFQAMSNFMAVHDVKRCLIRNLVMDWNHENERLQSLVKVVAVDPEGNHMDLVFPDDKKLPYPFALEKSGRMRWFKELVQVDPKRFGCIKAPVGLVGGWWFDPRKTEILKGGRLRLHLDVSHRLVSAGRLAEKGVAPGQHFVMRHHSYTAHGISVGDSSHLTFDTITIHATLGHGFVGGGDLHHWQVLNSRLVRHPSRRWGFSSGADGFHIIRSKGYFRFEGNEWAHSGDDLFNYHETFSNGIKITGPKTIVRLGCRSGRNRLAVGEWIEFRNRDFSPTGFKAKAKEVSFGPKETSPVTLDREIPPSVKEDAILFYPDYGSHNFIVRDNTFRDNRGRGLMFPASNGLIENNRFRNNYYPAIVLGLTARRWCEGNVITNVIIRNNDVRNCDNYGLFRTQGILGAITVHSFNGDDPAAPGILSRLAIYGNSIESTSAAGVYLSSVTKARVFDNTFRKINTAKLKLPGPVVIENDK